MENSRRLEERLNRKEKKQKTKNQSINQPNPTSDHLHRERLSSTRKGNVLSLEWLRSICGERFRGRSRRTPAWRSASPGRWRGKPRWSLRSRRSISSREER